MRRKVYTTGEIAEICNCSPRTVSKWFDSGNLKGYRLPMSYDRRIPHEHLIQFMIDKNIPIPKELTEECSSIS